MATDEHDGRRRSRRKRFVVFADREERFDEDDASAVQAVADPMRVRMLRRLAEPASAKELAGELGRPVTSLYHHLDLLESNGLIHVVDVSKEGRALVRRYQRTGSGRLETAVRRVTVAAGDLDDGRRRIRLIARGRIDPAKMDELERRLRSVVRELLDSDDGIAYEVAVDVAPTTEEGDR